MAALPCVPSTFGLTDWSATTDDLDTLTEWVVDLFTPVVSKDLKPVSFGPDPFGSELLGAFTYMRTVKDFLALELAWPIADQTELYHTKVCLPIRDALL